MKKVFFSILAAAFVLAACNDEDKGVTGVTLYRRGVELRQDYYEERRVTLPVSATLTLTATVQPENAANKKVAWTSSNTVVATVADGTITTLAVGTSTITVTTEDGNKTASCDLTVSNDADLPSDATAAVTGVTLSDSLAWIAPGDIKTLTATVLPAYATNKAVAWMSNNTAIATVSNGKVTAVAVGTADITVTTDDGSKTATCLVRVGTLANSLTLSNTTATLSVGNTLQLTAIVQPSNAINSGVKWMSSNTAVATVSSSGLITAVGAGSVTITAATVDDSRTSTCAVTVERPPYIHMTLGNITWAAANVDDYQIFAVHPDMYTKFYQWGRDKAWDATGSVSGWNPLANTSFTWTVNPCPAGWRLPTMAEFQTLHNAGSTWAAANSARGNAVAGRFYGPNHAACSLLSNMTGCIFLPAVGYRNYSDGTLYSQGSSGDYWSGTQGNSTNGYNWYFNSSGGIEYGSSKAYGFSVRCVQ